jgi:predicted ATPase
MPPPLIRQLKLQNFLSYGPAGMSVDLLPLNVLIGPNASGKSNLLEALALLRAAPSDLQSAIREGGGFGEYLWKGQQAVRRAQIHTSVARAAPGIQANLRHAIVLLQVGTRFDIGMEFIGMGTQDDPALIPIYLGEDGSATMFARVPGGPMEEMSLVDLKSSQSILAQRRDPDRFPEVTFLADEFARITLFREWTFGGRSAARLPQSTDLPSDYLLPDASNLGLVLHDLGQTSAKREELITYLRRFYEPARFISTKIQGGTLQLYIEEEGGQLIPATRLSDGTLRYLCLLAILCHPSPPPVIAIEEPELGLHPDILPTIAELLKQASQRTQLFVTTHSDALVSALSDTPESILVCEATADGTTMKRLEAEPLREWLEKYSLGEIWRMGEIGGNRW